MYSTEQRRLAIETFIRFDHSYADTIAELGYPDRHTLNSWWRECGETGEVPVGKMVREPRFSDGQKREAAEHCLGHGKSLSRTMRARLPEGQRHAARLDRRACPRAEEIQGAEPESGSCPARGEDTGGGRARVPQRNRCGGRREAWRAAHGALHLAQGDYGG